MERLCEQFLRSGLFDDSAGIHDGHLVRDFRDHAEVVRDQYEGHAEPFPELFQERQDLRLDRDVQSGGGFVRKDEVGIARNGHGDHDPLPHSAAELMRIFLRTPIG
jgi:hypothetical protein